MTHPALFLVLLAATILPDPGLSTATSNAGHIFISPGLARFTLADEDVVVHVQVLDANGDPIAGYPRQDIWLDGASAGELSICPDGSVADADTDAAGTTTFSGAIAGGGWTEEGLRVYLGGSPLLAAPLPIRVNSADITGNGRVDLSDVAEFGLNLFNGIYDFSTDFNDGGTEDIVDLVMLADHIGDACP